MRFRKWSHKVQGVQRSTFQYVIPAYPYNATLNQCAFRRWEENNGVAFPCSAERRSRQVLVSASPADSQAADSRAFSWGVTLFLIVILYFFTLYPWYRGSKEQVLVSTSPAADSAAADSRAFSDAVTLFLIVNLYVFTLNPWWRGSKESRERRTELYPLSFMRFRNLFLKRTGVQHSSLKSMFPKEI